MLGRTRSTLIRGLYVSLFTHLGQFRNNFIWHPSLIERSFLQNILATKYYTNHTSDRGWHYPLILSPTSPHAVQEWSLQIYSTILLFSTSPVEFSLGSTPAHWKVRTSTILFKLFLVKDNDKKWKLVIKYNIKHWNK